MPTRRRSKPPHLLLVFKSEAAPELALLKAQALVQALLLQAGRGVDGVCVVAVVVSL